MSRPIVICCAITGSRPRKADNPAVPVSPAEQIESAHEAFEAGATVLHLHVRDEHERPCFLPERFAVVMEGVYEHCPGMIIELSTGGVAGSPADRAASLPLRPDMAAIALGSVNFPNGVYHNPPDVIDELARTCADLHIKPCIEVFDLSMIYTPGVARVCLAIAKNPEDARRLTIKRNTVAVVTDGSAVLGLGNIGPEAAMPVISVKLAGELTREQKKEIVERFTLAMEEVAGKPRDYVVVSFESQPHENWGWGGKLLDEE